MNEHEDDREDEVAAEAAEPQADDDAGGESASVDAADDAEPGDGDGAVESEAEAPVTGVEDDAPGRPTEDDGGPPRITPLWQRLAYASPPLWYRVAQILLPPLLAAGAVGVHWWLNVPDKILESPKDQGSKARKDKKKKRAKKGRRAEREKPRTPEELDADWEVYRDVPFDEEPTRASWARRNQALLNRAMVVARRVAFEGAPEDPAVVLTSAKCRSVRCRFVLRSPYEHELDVMIEALRGLESEDESVWRDFQTAPATVPDGMPSHEHYLQVTVGLQYENTDTRTLEVPTSPEGSGGEVSGGEPEPSDDVPTQDGTDPPDEASSEP